MLWQALSGSKFGFLVLPFQLSCHSIVRVRVVKGLSAQFSLRLTIMWLIVYMLPHKRSLFKVTQEIFPPSSGIYAITHRSPYLNLKKHQIPPKFLMRIRGTSCQNFFQIQDLENFGRTSWDLQGSQTLTSAQNTTYHEVLSQYTSYYGPIEKLLRLLIEVTTNFY